MPDLNLVSSKNVETKVIGGQVISCKEVERNGIKVGIVEGYIATWDVDRGDWWGVKDQFVRGAFTESLNDLRMRKRQVRLKDHHGRTVGGFPIETVKEDERGLFGIGEINLEVQQGREAYALAKQGVLSDFSIGFSIDESSLDEQEELRSIYKAVIWEGSIVDEPMNPYANITAVKGLQTCIASALDDFKGKEVNEQLRDEIKSSIEKAIKGFEEDQGKIDVEGLKDMDGRAVEQQLKKTNLFSNKVCKLIVTKLIEEGKINGSDTEGRQTPATPNIQDTVPGSQSTSASQKSGEAQADGGVEKGDKGIEGAESKRIEEENEQKEVTLNALQDLCSTIKQRNSQ